MRQLCEAMGEELQVANYERLTPLAVEEGGLRGGYRRVQPGDCVVAFSRKSIFAIKEVSHFTASITNLQLAKDCVCCSLLWGHTWLGLISSLSALIFIVEAAAIFRTSPFQNTPRN